MKNTCYVCGDTTNLIDTVARDNTRAGNLVPVQTCADANACIARLAHSLHTPTKITYTPTNNA